MVDANLPIWEVTDWTPWQRSQAIRGLLTLGVSCSLLAIALVWWRSATAVTIPLGFISGTLICLGVALLNLVYWRPYWHAPNIIGEERRQASLLFGLSALEAGVAFGNALLQLLGALLAATIGWSAWTTIRLDSYAAIVLVGFAVTATSLVMREGIFTWRPQRDPVVRGSALGPSAHGVRLILRWLVMGVAGNGLLLIVASAFALAVRYIDLGSLTNGDLPPVLHGVPLTALFGVAAAFFLLAAVSELSLREQATPSATPS